MDQFARKMALLVGSFCCILYWKVEEDSNHTFWRCEFARFIWNLFI